MKNKEKTYLGYYVCGKKIIKRNLKKVASIDRDVISTDYKQLIIDINNAEVVSEPCNPEIKYTLYDSNNKIIAMLDEDYNLYNLNYQYIGSFKNISALFILLFFTFLILILSLILLFVNLWISKRIQPSPEYIKITEENGQVVVDKWNVFGKNESEKYVHPGRCGIYNFFIINECEQDLYVTLSFDDINLHDISMGYKLYCDDVILSESDNYLDIDGLNALDTENILLKANRQLRFRLDWKWISISDEDDTRIGNLEDAKYTIRINVLFESTD